VPLGKPGYGDVSEPPKYDPIVVEDLERETNQRMSARQQLDPVLACDVRRERHRDVVAVSQEGTEVPDGVHGSLPGQSRAVQRIAEFGCTSEDRSSLAVRLGD
jgi:hypothetical protein